MVDISDLLGVPYKPHGRDKSGFDCYGLVIEVCKRLGRTLEDFDYGAREYKSADEYCVFDNFIKQFSEVDSLEEGNIVLFLDSRGRTRHIAVCMDSQSVIHCDTRGVQILKINQLLYSNKRIYKWQK